MKTIAILGTGPLPTEGQGYLYGSSTRTWHFAKGLQDRGYRVHVISFRPMRVRDGEEIQDPEHRKYEEGGLTLHSVDAVRHFYDNRFLEDRIREVKASLLIGVNTFPASRAACLNLDLPIWADLNGFNMGEVQIRAHITGDEGAIPHGWNEELPALTRGDVFSAASHPQRFALIGELAAIGRLRGSTCGYEFVRVIPNAREDLPPPREEADLRKQLGPESVLALWIGCYNYQFDIETLFQGFERVFESVPNLHFVSTGGKVDGHNEMTFENFQRMVGSSRYKDRYHFAGWLPQEEFERLMWSADFGVTLDVPCYETEVGARNRLTDMMRVGLPVITTQGPEIAESVDRDEAGWWLSPRNVEEFSNALREAATSSSERKRRGANARNVFLERYTLEASLEPLFEWVENPRVAPDRGQPPLLLPSVRRQMEAGEGGFWSKLQRISGLRL